MNHIARWSVALTLLLFGATVDIAKAQNAGTLAATPASPSLSVVDYNFIAQANLGAPFQVDSGRLAEKKATTAHLHDYAHLMVVSHIPVIDDFNAILQQKDVAAPPNTLLHAAYDTMIASLKAENGAAFDRDYVNGQVDYQKGNVNFEGRVHPNVRANYLASPPLVVAKEYEGRIEMNDRIVDACAMQLVLDPWQFDVIVTTNLFGDILSDQLAGLVGGLGMAPGANIGPDAAIFEAVHGSAPDIAGKGIANPLALLLAVGLMLEHIDQPGLANRLRTSIDQVLRKDGVRTPDLGGKASTTDFTQSIIRRINQ